MSNPVLENERRFARSKIPQINYLTATDASVIANFKELLVSDKNLAKTETKAVDNKDESTGHQQATEEYKTVHDTSRATERRVCSEEAGRDLLLAFGSVATTQPDAANAPTVKKHKFKPMDLTLSKQLPAMTLIEVVGGAINRLLPSMIVEDYSLKGDGYDHIRQTMNLRGSGKLVEPSGIDAEDIAELTGLHFFTNTQVKLTIADSGTLDNDTDYGAARGLESWDFGIKWNLLAEEGYRPGAALYQMANDPDSGAIRSECLVSGYELSMSIVARLFAQSDQLAALRAKKKLDVLLEQIGAQIGATAFNHKLTVHAPKVSYDMVELGAKNGLVTVQLKPKIFFDTTSGDDATVELVNNVASYTA